MEHVRGTPKQPLQVKKMDKKCQSGVKGYIELYGAETWLTGVF